MRRSLQALSRLGIVRMPIRQGQLGGGSVLTANFTTLAEVLRQLGYETVGFSSNTFVSDKFGLARGFERFMWAWQLFQTQTDMAHVQEALSDYQGWRKARKFVRELTRENTLEYDQWRLRQVCFSTCCRLWAQRVNRHIKAWYSRFRDQEQPFFLFVNYMEAHMKYDPPGAYRYLFMPENIRKSDVNKV